MIIDHSLRLGNLAGLHPLFPAVHDFLSRPDIADLRDGVHTIDGDRLFAIVSRYHTKAPNAGRWEAHRRYVDIQYVARGWEMVGVAPLELLTIDEPYDARRDITFLRGAVPGGGNRFLLEQGFFAVFFPGDAHMPGLWVNAAEEVCKVVVKLDLHCED